MNVRATHNRKRIRIICMVSMAMGLVISSAYSVAPPPPDGPPAPIMTGIAVSGPAVVDAETEMQFVCVASYSDGTLGEVSVAWNLDSAAATINASGLLAAGNVSADQNATVTATYGGFTATQDITINYVVPVLASISIGGPAVVNEETSAQYSCTASYSDGSTAAVAATWSENSAYATIGGSGLLSAGSVVSDQNVTVTASFGGKTATHSVTIKYVPPTLEGIAISGPARVDEESAAQYFCTATYSDGTSATVTPNWSQNSGYAGIDASGRLVTASVTVDQNFTITASYGGKIDAYVVTLANVVKLTGISISGPASVSENTETQFVCMANYDNGSSVAVSADWSEDSAVASIDAGLLAVGNVEADGSLTITAAFGGRVASRSVAIWAEGSRVTYSLSGFGTIKADLWDETAQETRVEFAEVVNPDELEITGMEPGRWYQLNIYEYDAGSGVWEQVHTNWISM